MPISTRVLTGRATRGLFSLVSLLALAVVARATIGISYQMQLGNPSSATNDPNNHSHYLVQRDQFAMDYNDTTREPNWVSWDLTSDDVGSSGRSAFQVDTNLPSGFYQVQTTDYSGSGYDRGHMCPSADRTVTVADNQQVFVMSNMIPQAPDNNQGVWANFENYCRSLASAGNEVLITCGPSNFGSSTIASGVAIPGYTWKIAVVVPLGSGMAPSRITSSTRVIALKIPNIAGVRNTPWQNFVTSVAQIEADTGYVFFTALAPAIANALRVQVDGQSAVGAPSIVVQPSNQTTVVGGSATFSVTASGDAPLTYQWLKDDVEVPGATGATLNLPAVTAGDVGSYDVVVTNAVGSVTSNSANLVVTGLPPSISASPTSQTVGAGATVTFAVTASGSPTLGYQWRKNGSPIASATASVLTLVNVQSGDAANYDVVVTNSVSSATSSPATLTVNPSLPTIVTHPSAQNPTVGSNASFTVVAVGTNPLSYQWRKGATPLSNGGVISGATTATLSLTGVAAVDAGSYDCVVTNTLGSTTSNAAALTVSAPPPATVYWDFGTSAAPTASPTSGLTADISGGALSGGNNNGTTTLLTTTSASGSYSGASAGVNAGAAARTGPLVKTASGSAYFEFTLAPSAGKRLNATGISFGARSTSTGPQAYAVYSNLDSFGSPIASGTLSNDGVWRMITPASFTSVIGATAAPITFRIYGYNGTGSAGAGTANWRIDDLKLTIAAVFPPPTAPVVVGTTPVASATNVDVANPITITFNEAVSFTGSWFTISSAANGSTAATVTGGPTTFTLTPPSFFAYSDTITVSVLGAQVVDQASGTIHGTSDTTFTFTTAAYVPPTPPSVTTQPNSQTVNAGTNVSFTVAANGTAPLNYQWRRNGTPIAGNASAGTAMLSLNAVTTADAGNYDCVVSNVAGSDVSQVAVLGVTIVPPTITTQPTAQIGTVGGSASFTVAATGTAPFAYQWRRNGVPLAGNASASTATLTLTNLAVADDGTYDVVVTNGSPTSATSNGAALAVTDAVNVIYWDFATAAPTSGVPAGVTGGTITQGNNNGSTTLLTTTSASGSYTGASGGNNAGAAARIGALNQAAGGSAYFEFAFSAAAGRQLAATAITFGMRSTGTGPQAFALYSSADGYATPLATGVVPNDSTWRAYTPRFASVIGNGAGNPLTFRLFGYNGTGSPGAGTANWRIDDVKLTAGVLALPPVAPTITTSPASQTATVNDNVTFTVAASGTTPFTYQWRKNGAPIGGATNATLTLNAITSAAAADYDVVVSNVVGSTPSAVATLTVLKAAATVTLDNLTATYDGNVHAVSATTSPAGLTVDFTYNGSPTAPVNAGNYTVVATINDPNYAGSTTATLQIAKASAAVALDNLNQGFDGAPKPVTVTTTPSGLLVHVTYAGSPTAPTAVGAYSVSATVDEVNYAGSATGTLTITKATASITLSSLSQVYDGLPHPVVATTSPAGLTVVLTYNGSSTAPVVPGAYAVGATINDPNYEGTASGTLRITITALVRHLGTLNGGIDGSVQVLAGENVTLNTRAWISGDLLVPGTPSLRLSGSPIIAGVTDGSGITEPSSYEVALTGSSVLQYLLRRTDPIALPSVSAPPAPVGTRNVTLNAVGQSAGDFATLRNLTINGSAGDVAVPAGTYGTLTATGTSNAFVLGHAGATELDVYNLQGLALNGARIKVLGPVLIVLANGATVNGAGVAASPSTPALVIGDSAHPEWLSLDVAVGGLTLNGAVAVYGYVVAPNGTVTVNSSGTLTGHVAADRLTLNGSGVLVEP